MKAGDGWFSPQGMCQGTCQTCLTCARQIPYTHAVASAYPYPSLASGGLCQVHACMIDPTSPYAVMQPSHWNPHQVTQTLMNALSRVLLPDVSRLPLLEVPELKDKVKDELNPMRGNYFG